MILADEPSAALVGAIAAVAVGVITQLGAWWVKRTKAPEAPSLEQKLMDEWEAIAVEAREELAECRRERQRQDRVIEGQDKRIGALAKDLQEAKATFERELGEFRNELSQWRNGQRVPEGFVLQRAPQPPAPEKG